MTLFETPDQQQESAYLRELALAGIELASCPVCDFPVKVPTSARDDDDIECGECRTRTKAGRYRERL